MKDRTGIDALSITDGKISNQAKINPKKIAPAAQTSILIAQSDKKYQPKVIWGDGTIDATGKLTITTQTPVVESFTTEDRKKLDSIEENATKTPTPTEVREIIREFPNQVKEFKSADNAEPGTKTVITVEEKTTTIQAQPNKKFEMVVSGTTGSGPNSNTEFSAYHNFGFLPQAQLYRIQGPIYNLSPWTTSTSYNVGDKVKFNVNGKNYRCITSHTSSSSNEPTDTSAPWAELNDQVVIPIEAEIVSTTTTTTVKFTQSIGTLGEFCSVGAHTTNGACLSAGGEWLRSDVKLILT